MRVQSVLLGSVLSVLAFPAVAAADETWLLTGSFGGTVPIGSPYDDAFGPGVSADVGVYRSLVPWMLLGGRVGGTVLTEGEGRSLQGNGGQQPGAYLLARTASVLARVRPLAREGEATRSTGLWIETGVGPGISESGEMRPILEGAVGWGVNAGFVTIAPALRYERVFEPEGSLGGHDANLLTFGVEATLLDRTAPAQQASTAFQTPRAVTGDSDSDGILDEFDRCGARPETYNGINDHDGCPDTAQLGLVGDRIVFDERVFFAFDEAAVTPSGRERLRDLSALAHRNGWTNIRIEGHADARGSVDYNRDLSAERAENVRRALVEFGCEPANLTIAPMGETAPTIYRADTEAEHALNRRVEFVVRPAPPDGHAR